MYFATYLSQTGVFYTSKRNWSNTSRFSIQSCPQPIKIKILCSQKTCLGIYTVFLDLKDDVY
jgi:hypothetical protein